jgi:hypothetical protein
MSFDVFLIPSSASPPDAQFGRAVQAVVIASGGRAPSEDSVMMASDGGEFELFGGSMFALRGLSPGICEVIFRSAARTNSYIVPTSDEAVVLKVKGTVGRGPKDLGPIKLIANSQGLCGVLEHGYRGWRAYADHVHNAINR